MKESEKHFPQKEDTYVKKKVLIADDSEEFCYQLMQSLKKYDALEIVGIAHDGEKTIHMMKQLKPDILVLDLLLAKRDGINILKEIYSMDNRPVVVATSGVPTDSVALGAHYLMMKPCDIDSLTELIGACWDGNESQKTPQKDSVTGIETMVKNILRDISVPSHIKGYHYLREAFIIVAKDMDMVNAPEKALYPQIARTYQTTPSRVAHAMQHAVEVAWSQRDRNGLDRFFGTIVSKRSDKITVEEFLLIIAYNIRSTLGMKI